MYVLQGSYLNTDMESEFIFRAILMCYLYSKQSYSHVLSVQQRELFSCAICTANRAILMCYLYSKQSYSHVLSVQQRVTGIFFFGIYALNS